VNLALHPLHPVFSVTKASDASKFVRIAVEWLLRSDIGEVIKTIVDHESFPDYATPKKPAGQKKQRQRKPRRS
jgi:hypothetical protein